MPYGFLTGPNQLYGYDPATGKLYALVEDGFGTYNLATIMGGGEVVFELNTLIDHAGWKKAWAAILPAAHRAASDVIERDKTTGTEGDRRPVRAPGPALGIPVLADEESGVRARRRGAACEFRAWRAREPQRAGRGDPIEEVPALSTNSVAQGCLEVIEVLEMCGDSVPQAG